VTVRLGVLALCLALLVPASGRGADIPLDDFEDVHGWSAQASPGASLEIAQDAGKTGNAMRLDFDFRGGAGFVIARKAFPITVPANYAFVFDLRGDARPQNLEFKVVEAKGDDVWWRVQRDFAFPSEWQRVVKLYTGTLLDGFHLVMVAAEKIKGSAVNAKLQEIFMYAGLAIIGSLLVYVMFNDVSRFFS